MPQEGLKSGHLRSKCFREDRGERGPVIRSIITTAEKPRRRHTNLPTAEETDGDDSWLQRTWLCLSPAQWKGTWLPPPREAKNPEALLAYCQLAHSHSWKCSSKQGSGGGRPRASGTKQATQPADKAAPRGEPFRAAPFTVQAGGLCPIPRPSSTVPTSLAFVFAS